MLGGGRSFLSSNNIELLISELCGPIPNEDKQIIVSKTFSTFDLDKSETISEKVFVEVKFHLKIFYLVLFLEIVWNFGNAS
jgi:hypothetical protein